MKIICLFLQQWYVFFFGELQFLEECLSYFQVVVIYSRWLSDKIEANEKLAIQCTDPRL